VAIFIVLDMLFLGHRDNNNIFFLPFLSGLYMFFAEGNLCFISLSMSYLTVENKTTFIQKLCDYHASYGMYFLIVAGNKFIYIQQC
jgi:hypothetical protein